MNTSTSVLPQVNGVVLSYPNEALTIETLRQRACAELLRQAAIEAGLLAADDPAEQQAEENSRDTEDNRIFSHEQTT